MQLPTSSRSISLIAVGLIWLGAILACVNGNRAPASSTDSPKVALLSTRIERSSESYFRVYGEVRNISSAPIRALFAVGNFRDEKGLLISSDAFVVDPNIIPPGSNGTFLIMGRFSPDIKTYDIVFRDVWSNAVQSEDRRPAPTPVTKKKK